MSDVDGILLAARVPLRDGDAALVTPRLATAVACSDDLWVGPHRLTVRAFVRPAAADGWIVDLRDSSTAPSDAATPTVAVDDVRFAAVHAFSDALRLEAADARLARHIELQTDDTTWVGNGRPCDAALQLFGIARIYDAIAGALALAWLDPGRAGSCSLGAIVMATDVRDAMLVDVVPGGRGAELRGSGDSLWPGPVLPAGLLRNDLGVAIERAQRPASGGGGARNGGDGMIARYTFSAPARVRVAIDRITNPPHGLDRAGPPLPAELVRIRGGVRSALAPWATHDVAPGDLLEVDTAGGAGHGFPGWGIDFEWEP